MENKKNLVRCIDCRYFRRALIGFRCMKTDDRFLVGEMDRFECEDFKKR